MEFKTDSSPFADKNAATVGPCLSLHDSNYLDEGTISLIKSLLQKTHAQNKKYE